MLNKHNWLQFISLIPRLQGPWTDLPVWQTGDMKNFRRAPAGLWIFCLTAKTVFLQREYARGQMQPCLPETEHSFKVKCLTCDFNVTVKFFARCDYTQMWRHLKCFCTRKVILWNLMQAAVQNTDHADFIIQFSGQFKLTGSLLGLWKKESEQSS